MEVLAKQCPCSTFWVDTGNVGGLVDKFLWASVLDIAKWTSGMDNWQESISLAVAPSGAHARLLGSIQAMVDWWWAPG